MKGLDWIRAGSFLSLQVLLGPADSRAQQCQPYWVNLPASSDVTSAFTTTTIGSSGSRGQLVVSKLGNSQVGYTSPAQLWNGRSFVPLGPGISAMAGDIKLLDDGQSGSRLYLSARTPPNSGVPLGFRWNGAAWVPMPPAMLPVSSQGTYAMAFPKFSTGLSGVNGLYGNFSPEFVPNRFIVRWSGTAWKPIGVLSNLTGIVQDPMMAYTEGGVNYIVVSGVFEEISGVPAHRLARWDGREWTAMGTPPTTALALSVYDDGTGPSLYMGYNGTISNDPMQREGVARWTGTSWVSVGGGTNRTDMGYGGVNAMAVFDDGSGPALFVAGSFNRAGGIPALQVAKWNGQAWSALGAGISGFIKDMTVANDGRGDSLFILGDIFGVGGSNVYSDIVQWVGCRGQCYANCDNSTASPRLNVNDFMCFLDAFARREPYANCTVDHDINAADFICFMNKFAAGCP